MRLMSRPWIWFDEAGNLMSEAEWNNPERRSFGIYLDGEANGSASPLVLLFNAGGDELHSRSRKVSAW